jgi:hypothetical protein
MTPLPTRALAWQTNTMPLSDPAPRTLLHRRDIQLRGYHRADGLFDIEAHLTDTKDTPFEHDTHGPVPGGTPIHDMWVRLTVGEDMVVREAEAASDHTPYAICPGAAPNFARLAGLKIGPGFSRAVAERVREHLSVAIVEYALAKGIRSFTMMTHMAFLSGVIAVGWDCEPLGMPQDMDGVAVAALMISVDERTLPRLRRQWDFTAAVLRHDLTGSALMA